MTILKGSVTSAELCEPLKDVKIKRENTNNDNVVYSDSKGEWILSDLQEGEKVTFEKEGFTPKTFRLGTLPKVVRLLEDQLIGYQEKLWFCPGEEVQVFVHSSRTFSVKLYCHGFNKNLILDLGKFDAFEQSVPDTYFVESGLSWKKNFSYQIPENARPGLYSLLLESKDQEDFAIPFIVSTLSKDFGKKSKLLVLASTNTWQSYNLWGGRSRYRNFEDGQSKDFLEFSKSYPSQLIRKLSEILPSKIKNMIKKLLGKTPPEWKFKKLSVQRPFTNCRLEQDTAIQPFTNHLAGGEWRLLAWLERENIPYDIISGFELHKNPELLSHYDAIILCTHSEYWSRQMYDGLKYFHQQKGLWILNISGNSIYRGIEFFEDGSIRCVSYFFSESGEDETQILGVRFSEGDYGTCAFYKILLPNHWIFKNIPFNKKTRTFGGLSLNQNTLKEYKRYDPGRPGLEMGLEGNGASGWETDKLSKTASKDFSLVAKGMNSGGGADMVVREPHGSRGGVFSASSITFSGSLLIDNTCSMIVKNVLSRLLQ